MFKPEPKPDFLSDPRAAALELGWSFNNTDALIHLMKINPKSGNRRIKITAEKDKNEWVLEYYGTGFGYQRRYFTDDAGLAGFLSWLIRWLDEGFVSQGI